MMSKTLQLFNAKLSGRGQSVHCLTAGRGEPLVLVHGVGMQAAAWQPQIDALSDSYHVIAVDMPGHGGSSLLPEEASLAVYVTWMADVLRELDFGPVNLAGHSMGALIALGTAIEHPALVSRVAALNCVYRRSADARAAVLIRAGEIARGEGSMDGPLSRWFDDGASEQQARTLTAGWLNDVNPQGYAMAYQAFAEGDTVYADRLGEIRCPALILTGDGDPNSTPEMSSAMASAIAHGHAVLIKGHRHMVNLTAPEATTSALRDWLHTSNLEHMAKELPC